MVLMAIGRLPGVVSAGFTTFLPSTTRIGAGPIAVENRPDPGNGSNVAIIRYVTPDYLKARDSAISVAADLAVGFALAAIVSRSRGSLIYGVGPLDWMSLATSRVCWVQRRGWPRWFPSGALRVPIR